VHDVKLLAVTLDAIVIPRPRPGGPSVEHLCADAGYKGKTALAQVRARGYCPHVKQRREEAPAKRTQPGFKARRWVVERSFAWAARFRRLARDYERLASSLAGLHWLAFACLMLNSLFRQSA
jgi:transposase